MENLTPMSVRVPLKKFKKYEKNPEIMSVRVSLKSKVNFKHPAIMSVRVSLKVKDQIITVKHECKSFIQR